MVSGDLFCLGAMCAGLGTFRGRNAGVWPPLKAMQMDFSAMSSPDWFDSDPRLADFQGLLNVP